MAQKDCIEQLRPFHTFKQEISTIDGLLFKGQKLIVPAVLKSKFRQVLHRSHMGVTKTQERARSTFFWVGKSKDIEQVIGNCEVGQNYAKRQPKEGLGNVQDISEAWESTATDLFEFKDNIYLVISCRFSGYIAISDMKDHSAEEIIRQCQSIFSELECLRHSTVTEVPIILVSNFRSVNLKLTFGSSEHHSSNYAERSVQTVKNFMRKSHEWSICLLEYHLTPIRHQCQCNSPIRLMQQRTLRGILPARQQETKQENYERFRTRNSEQSQYQLGQDLPKLPIRTNILYYNHIRNIWFPGVLVDRVHDRSYTIISQKGRMLSRNRIDLKPYNKEVVINYEQPKLPSSPFEMQCRHTHKKTDTDRKHTSSQSSSQEKTQMVHTKMAHTKLGHTKPSSQTNRHCNRHYSNSSSYSPSDSPHCDSPPTLSTKSHQTSPSQGCLKGSTSANQRMSLAANTQRNQSPNACNAKGKRDLKSVKLPKQTRSGKSVHPPERYRD